ncbi:MAG TPA: polysaccharide deacetylase [Hellea balneolensis]|uniref:Chitooligosaccharide deacetylase n=1 Tax=Hellea balneolensis TaxID=287478 RepID=A0A7C5M004_9PROT|nr:polysaccharide deacetylase [Hellea balneolensis]
MGMPYQPNRSLRMKLARKLLPFQAQRPLKFHLERPIVSFTFDDFARSAISNGARVLEQENWRGTFYVSAGLKGVTNHHGENFNTQDILTLQAQGHEIAGHTYSHVDCTTLNMDHVRDEISKNHKALRAMGVTGTLDHFAFPYGAANPVLKKSLAKQFKSLRGIRPGVHHTQADLNGLKSAPLFSGAKLDYALELIEGLKSRPAWLTLFAHDICDNPSEWGCTPNEFSRVVQQVKDTGADVLTIGKAITFLENTHEQS